MRNASWGRGPTNPDGYEYGNFNGNRNDPRLNDSNGLNDTDLDEFAGNSSFHMNKRNNWALAQLEPLRHKPTSTIGKVSRDEIKNMMTPEMGS